MPTSKPTIALVVALASSLAAGAAANVSASPQIGASSQKKDNPRITKSQGFVSARRDLFHREQGIRHLNDGHYAAAAEAFRNASRYADKISQAAYAELLWEGHGMAQDRALAYAWMDLAAERGSRPLLAKRELYWEALSEPERARALDIGKAVYDEYGDDVAQPRQEREMQRARRNVTGSRLGAVSGSLRIIPASEIMGNDWTRSIQAMGGISGHEYYADHYWVPEEHWKRQDDELERGLIPRVRVGEFEEAGATRPAQRGREADSNGD